MGIQQITERAEVQKTAASHQTGFRVPDLAGAAAAGPASLGKALAGVGDGVKGVGLALAKIDETDADAAVREIRKFSDHVLNVGYRDPRTGVQQPGIAADERIEMVRGSANRHDALVNDYARRMLDGANENVRRLVSEKTDEMRSRITHSLKKREVLAEANFQYRNLGDDVQERIGSFVDSQLMASRQMRNGSLAEYVAGNAAAAAAEGELSDEEAVARMQNQATSAGEAFARDYHEGFEDLRRECESVREGMARRLETFCLHGSKDAANKADLTAKKMATDVIAALVKDGDFDRANSYAERMTELGFTEEQKSDQIRLVEKARKADMARAEAERSAERQRQRDESTARQLEFHAGNPRPADVAAFYRSEADQAKEAGNAKDALSFLERARRIEEGLERQAREEARARLDDEFDLGWENLHRDGRVPTEEEKREFFVKWQNLFEKAGYAKSAAQMAERASGRTAAIEEEKAKAASRQMDDEFDLEWTDLHRDGRVPTEEERRQFFVRWQDRFEKAGYAKPASQMAERASGRTAAIEAEKARAMRLLMDRNHEDLEWMLIREQSLRARGMAAQANVLRNDIGYRMAELETSRGISASDLKSFRREFSAVMDPDSAVLVRMFDEKFGMDLDTDGSGDVSAAEVREFRDSGEDFRPEWAKGDEFDAKTRLRLRREFIGQLGALPPTIDRKEAAEAVLKRFETRYVKMDFERRIGYMAELFADVRTANAEAYGRILSRRNDAAKKAAAAADAERKRKAEGVYATPEALEKMRRESPWDYTQEQPLQGIGFGF